MRAYIFLFLKGVAMGAANVIPGVSGGTIAFVTGIYNDLISSLKSFDLKAIKMLLRGDIKNVLEYTNALFLVILFSGVVVGLVSFGKLLKFAVNHNDHAYEIHVWAFFFGLILASVYSVGKTIKDWDLGSVASIFVGVGLAVSLVFVGQAHENDVFWYLILCGAVSMASMLLPGLSGSFVLMLMGNYYLIMLEAVPNKDLYVIGFVGVGAVIGFALLSRLISFLLNSYEKKTISLLTGFIFGSLLTIWPWKDVIRETLVGSGGKEKEVIMGFSNWRLPVFDMNDIVICLMIVLGVSLVLAMEFVGNKYTKKS